MRWIKPTLLIVVCFALVGCSNTLIDTPYIMYGQAGITTFAQTPEHLQTSRIPVIYVTDREATRVSERGPEYTHRRSPTLSYGIATVSLNDKVNWEELVHDSTRKDRSHTYIPRVSHIEERGDFIPMTRRFVVEDGRATLPPEAFTQLEEEFNEFHELLSTYLDHTDFKDAVVFIHGFNNTFDDSVLRLAEAWHFTGRQGVPIVYSWPAGSGGLKGYAFDRESGEFTVVHLKLLLAALAKAEQVERVHIISHSRGTDVAVTALRELHNELRGASGTGMLPKMLELPAPALALGESPRTSRDILKIDTLILAAPDIDLDVFGQRFFGENLLGVSEQTAIYFSSEDKALGLANWLFRSKRRVGSVRPEDLSDEVRERIAQLNHLQLINAKVSGHTSHSYILQHPAALSDLILLLLQRENRQPGADSGRPLGNPYPGIWQLDNDYLKPKP